jgi:hypothetical protein
MKKAILAALMLQWATNIGYAQASAGDYLDLIGKEFNEIQKNTWDYTRSAAHGKSARKVERRRKEVVSSNKDAIRKISGLKPHNGNTNLRDSAVSFLKVNYAVLNEDYAKLMDMEEISEQSYDAMEAYMLAKEKANEKLHSAGDMIETEYNKFARDNGINLIEKNDKLSRNMAIANLVYKHYNHVYLVFFKSYKQEAYLMDAMSRNDVNAIEQNRSALSKTAADGLEKLKSMEAYEGDNSLVKACQDMLTFYKLEADKKLAAVSAFYVAKDNFDKIKASFETKPADQRNKEDVDRYNQSVSDYNAATNDYNKVTAELNSLRSALIQNWNQTGDKFTDKHVPNK